MANVSVTLETVPLTGLTIKPFDVSTAVPTVPWLVAAVRVKVMAPVVCSAAAFTGVANVTTTLVTRERGALPPFTVKPVTFVTLRLTVAASLSTTLSFTLNWKLSGPLYPAAEVYVRFGAVPVRVPWVGLTWRC